MPGFLENDAFLKEAIKAQARDIKIPLLVGSVSSKDNQYFNSAILISEEGQFLQKYDKLHLVPFGEYIPLKKIFSFLETVVPIGDFVPGEEYTVFSLDAKRHKLNAIRFSVLICFEDLFAGLSRQFVKKGAGFLVNITNDAWFGDTSSPEQHLQASVFRAVENRRYLVRAANTGMSGFISPCGRLDLLKKNNKSTYVSGYKTENIFIAKDRGTIYTRFGDFFILICLVIVGVGAIIRSREAKNA